MSPKATVTTEQLDQIVRHAREGFTYSSIAALVDVPTSTVSFYARQAGITRTEKTPFKRPVAPHRFPATRPHSTWWEDAACAGADINLFYPPTGDRGTIREAQTICRGCPVRDACIEDALSRPFEEGIWGGLTSRDRSELHAARRTA